MSWRNPDPAPDPEGVTRTVDKVKLQSVMVGASISRECRGTCCMRSNWDVCNDGDKTASSASADAWLLQSMSTGRQGLDQPQLQDQKEGLH